MDNEETHLLPRGGTASYYEVNEFSELRVSLNRNKSQP